MLTGSGWHWFGGSNTVEFYLLTAKIHPHIRSLTTLSHSHTHTHSNLHTTSTTYTTNITHKIVIKYYEQKWQSVWARASGLCRCRCVKMWLWMWMWILWLFAVVTFAARNFLFRKALIYNEMIFSHFISGMAHWQLAVGTSTACCESSTHIAHTHTHSHLR